MVILIFIKISKKIKIGCIQKPLSIYRIHEKNYSKIKLKNYILELKNWIKENDCIFKEEGYTLFYQKIYLLKIKFKIFIEKIIKIMNRIIFFKIFLFINCFIIIHIWISFKRKYSWRSRGGFFKFYMACNSSFKI